MAQAIKMPKLSDDMQEGTLVKWFKNVGDVVEEGEILVEIETDKANMEVECFSPGTLAAQSVAEGETVPIGTVIAMIAESEEEFESLVNEAAKQSAAKIEGVESDGGDDVEEDGEDSADQNGPDGHTQLHVVEEIGGPRKATPVARRIAEEHGVSLVEIQGTGPRGRIVKDDVEKHIQAGKPKAAVPIPAQVLPLDQKRKYIVRKMVESKTTIPHYYLGVDVKVDEMLKLRKEYNVAKETKVTITDFIVKASAMALETYPLVNAHFDEDVIKYKEHINIAIAVDTGEILMAPVVKNCESKPLSVLSTETRGLVDKARDKKLKPEDYEGGTFYISNIGGFGIDEIAPIIFPTTSAILGIGAIAEKAVVEGGEVLIGSVMKIILSADHRVLDGARGAEFLKQVKDNLEKPLLLLA